MCTKKMQTKKILAVLFVLHTLYKDPLENCVFRQKYNKSLLCICKVEVIHRRTTQMSPLEITLVILLVTIIAFVSGKVPFSVISTGIILALILTGIKTPAEAFGGFINTNVVMFVAMFVIVQG